MKATKIPFCKVVMTLFATLAIPVGSTAQGGVGHGHRPHHYQLIDMGTFGGPQSSIVDQGVPGGVYLNNAAMFTGYADSGMPDPNQKFCFLDCYVDRAFQWQDGIVTKLDVLHHGLSSAPVAISANGLIAGFATNGETDPLFPGFPELRAVLWHNGHITDLGTLPEGGYESMANSINSRGQVVGFALNTIPDPDSFASIIFNNLAGSTQSRAFLWENGAMQDLGTLGGPDAAALLINERGQAMGWSYTSSTEAGVCFPLAIGSFIWEKERGIRDIGSLGGTCTLAQDLNNRGQIAGYSFPPDAAGSVAFLWEHDSFRELGGSIGGDCTGAFVLNDAGEVAGFGCVKGNFFFHATFWSKDGQITDLGTVGSDPCSSAKAINDKGQVVGDSISLSNCQTTLDASRAFLWEDGAIFDLNALIPAGSPLYLIHPQNINDRGEIAGFGLDASGGQHAFLLIPCDEEHPGREGCDYSLVDTTLADQAGWDDSMHSPSFTTEGKNTRGFLNRQRHQIDARSRHPIIRIEQ